MAFKFTLLTADGDLFGSFESARPDWNVGDTVIAAGNVRYKVIGVIPVDRIAEFVDQPVVGVLEVEPL